MSVQARRPAGSPAGGQFSASRRSEPRTSLTQADRADRVAGDVFRDQFPRTTPGATFDRFRAERLPGGAVRAGLEATIDGDRYDVTVTQNASGAPALVDVAWAGRPLPTILKDRVLDRVGANLTPDGPRDTAGLLWVWLLRVEPRLP